MRPCLRGSRFIYCYEWKEALVTPILKKPGLDPTQLNNLRLVSKRKAPTKDRM